MSWTFIKRKAGSSETYYVHSSFRKNGRVTSTTCGCIRDVERIREEKGTEFDLYIKEEGQRIYEAWVRESKTQHVFTLSEERETERIREIYSSQVYLKKVWNDIGLKKELSSLQKKGKDEPRSRLEDLIFFLASSQILEAASKQRAFLPRDRFLFCPEDVTPDFISSSLKVLAENANAVNLRTYRRSIRYLEKKSTLLFYDRIFINMGKSIKVTDPSEGREREEVGPVVGIGFLCDESGLLIGLLLIKRGQDEQESVKEHLTETFGSAYLKNIVICSSSLLTKTSNKRYFAKKMRGYIAAQNVSDVRFPEAIRRWAVEDPFQSKKESMIKALIVKRYEEAIAEKDFTTSEALLNTAFYKSKKFLSTVKVDDEGKEVEEEIREAEGSNKSAARIRGKELQEMETRGKKLSFQKRIVCFFNLRNYLRQKGELDELASRAKEAVAKNEDVKEFPKNGFRRFLRVERITNDNSLFMEKAVEFQLKIYEKELSLCGLQCFFTNLEEPEEDIYAYNRGRLIVDYIFRNAKTHFGLNPFILQNESQIKGFFEMVTLATNTLLNLVYKVLARVEYLDEKQGEKREAPFEMNLNRLLDEIFRMRSAVISDDADCKCLISLRSKNEVNKLMSDVFGFSLTTQARSLSSIKELLD